MVEKNNSDLEKNSSKKANKSDEKHSFFLTRIIIILSLFFIVFFGFKYLQSQYLQHQEAKDQVKKYDNIENEIFDLGKEDETEVNVEVVDDLQGDSFVDLNAENPQEKGVEFIYHMLLKNQIRINNLEKELQNLRAELLKYKTNEKIGKLIFAYVDLRQQILDEKNYDQELRNFRILSSFDENLQYKIRKLRILLKTLPNNKELSEEFAELVPEILANQNQEGNSSFLSKLRHNIAKLVIVRKVGDENLDNVDIIISKVKKSLQIAEYQQALDYLSVLDETNQKILANFLIKLNKAAEFENLDQEILDYLQNLT